MEYPLARDEAVEGWSKLLIRGDMTALPHHYQIALSGFLQAYHAVYLLGNTARELLLDAVELSVKTLAAGYEKGEANGPDI